MREPQRYRLRLRPSDWTRMLLNSFWSHDLVLILHRTNQNPSPSLARKSSFLGKPLAKVNIYMSLFQFNSLTSLAAVGPNNSYVTSTTAGAPAWVGWSQQLNLTYVPFFHRVVL